MIKCPNCGTLAQDGSAFCESCIFDLADAKPATPEEVAAAGGGAPPVAAAAMAEPVFEAVAMPAGDVPMAAAVATALGAAASPGRPGAKATAITPQAKATALTPQAKATSLSPGAMGAKPTALAPEGYTPGNTTLTPAAPGATGVRPPTGLAAPVKQPTNLAGTPPPGGTSLRPPTGLASPAAPAPRPPTNLAGGAPPKQPTNLAGAAPPKQPTNLAGAAAPNVSQVKLGTFLPAGQGSSMVGMASMAAPAAPAAAKPKSMLARTSLGTTPRLIVVRGLKAKLEFPLYEGGNYIGRFGDMPVDIDITDQEAPDKVWASRQHACVICENTKLFLEDMNSGNGTFLNRTRLNPGEKQPLNNGDYIQTGSVMFQLKF